MLLEGVALIQYAAVIAAVEDAFALDEALGVEGVPAESWPLASGAWKRRLVADASELERYKDALAAAQDRLARRVAPLDDDLTAWMSFLHLWGRHREPFELLKGFGARMNDMARLQRRWAKKLEADPELARRAADIARKKAFVEIEALSLGTSKLRRSSAVVTTPKAEAAERPAPASAEAPLELHELASLRAELDAFPKEHARVFARHGITTLAAREAIEREVERLLADPALRRDWRVFYALAQRRAAWASSAGERPTREPPGEPVAPTFVRLQPPAPPVDLPAQTSYSLQTPEALPPARTARKSAKALPELSVEQHAALHVELALQPDDAAAILARHGLTTRSKRQLDAEWQRALMDPALQKQWHMAYQSYQAWLVRRMRY